MAASAGDVVSLNMPAIWSIPRVLNLTGGHTSMWGITSYQQGLVSSLATYGTYYANNTRNDLPNSKLIMMWGWDPASTISARSKLS